MNINEAIQHHRAEMTEIKARLYDYGREIERLESRLTELGGVLAALDRAKELGNPAGTDASGDKHNED